MTFNWEKYNEQNIRVSQILSYGDETGTSQEGLFRFLQDRFFENPLERLEGRTIVNDPNMARILNGVGIAAAPNDTYVEPFKMGLHETIAAITSNGEPVAVRVTPNMGTDGSLELFRQNQVALTLASKSPIRCTPGLLASGVDRETGEQFNVRTLIRRGEEINLLATLQHSYLTPGRLNFSVFPNFFTLDADIQNPIYNINLFIRLMESQDRSALTKYFLSKFIALRTIMTASTVHTDGNGNAVALAPSDLMFCAGDAMGFTTNNNLDMRAVAFPGCLEVRSLDELLNQISHQQETAYLEDGLTEGPRIALGMMPQVSMDMPNRDKWIKNIIGHTLKGIFENLPGKQNAGFKDVLLQLVGNGRTITPQVIENSTSPYTGEVLFDPDNQHFGTRIFSAYGPK